MFSHVTVGANDMTAMARFYDAVFAPLGVERFAEGEQGQAWVAWRAPGTKAAFYLGTPFDKCPATVGNGVMNAFFAPSIAAVAEAHAAGMAAGGTDEGAPGPRPHYAADYHGAYLRDPEGNKLHIVHRSGVTA